VLVVAFHRIFPAHFLMFGTIVLPMAWMLLTMGGIMTSYVLSR
jgi:hypothetical protein